MEKYRPKTVIAELSDRLFRFGAACLTGVVWFVMLWGLTAASISSGIAFGLVIWMCIRQFSKKITGKREAQMRRTIGGELALEKLLLESPRRAALLCTLWITPKYDLEIEKAVGWSVAGMMNGQKTIVMLISQHPSLPIGVQAIIECVRQARRQQMKQTILCLTAPLSREAKSFASSLDPPPCIIERDELIKWAGIASPATDEDLRKLGRQNNTRRSAKDWLAVVLNASRARKYFSYGAAMALYGAISHNRFYTIPSIACLCLYICCKVRACLLNDSRRWKV